MSYFRFSSVSMVFFVLSLFGAAVVQAEESLAIGSSGPLLKRAFGLCSADCGSGGSVSCNGSSCSAQDDVGCRFKDEQGEWQSESCPIAFAAPVRVNDEMLVDEILAMNDLREQLNDSGTLRAIYSLKSLASCTADCGGGRSVTCDATGGDSCFAVDGVACQTYHEGGEYTHNSCNYN